MNNKFEDKVIEWSERQLNVKNCSKESLNLFRTKNGITFKKLFNFMSERIKSKENGETIKRFCDSIECKDQLKLIETEIQDIESNITRIRHQLIEEEFKRKSNECKDNVNENKAFVSTLVLNAIERISAKNKHFTQLRPNLMSVNETIRSFETLFTPIGDFCPENTQSFGQTLSTTHNKNWIQIVDQINQMIETIETILYDLSEVKTIKPIVIGYDLQLLFKSLSKSDPIVEVLQQNINEKKMKDKSISSKFTSVENLMTKYQTIRTEKLTKNRDKLEKVIKSCDESIQQKRLKCFEMK